jgi:hypothetical protein
MKYMQNGGFQSHPLMRLTLALTLVFMVAFVITNFFLFFSRMDLTPSSVATYYNGSLEEFTQPRSLQSMLEVTHSHLPMMALVLLLLTHLVIFAPYTRKGKIMFISVAFLSGLINEGASWLVRFVSPTFAWLKLTSFLLLQGSLIFLLITLGLFLLRASSDSSNIAGTNHTPAGRDRHRERTDRPTLEK